MIDLHSHLLPGIDDGARTLEESLKLLEALKKASFHTVFLTPHVSSKRLGLGKKEQINQAFETLKAAANEKGLNLTLHLGSEFDAHSKTHHELAEGFTLAQSNVLLLDLSYAEESYEEVLYTLKVSGYRVILAHVERYAFLSTKDIIDLRQSGIHCQMNLMSVLPQAPSKHRKRAKQYLKQGLIDVLGTDTHRYYDSYGEDLIETLNIVRKKTDAQTFKRMSEDFVREVILDA